MSERAGTTWKYESKAGIWAHEATSDIFAVRLRASG
jgi:hypothetical protein